MMLGIFRTLYHEIRRAWSNYTYWKRDREEHEAWEREQWRKNEKAVH
jgi:hypothetical protein